MVEWLRGISDNGGLILKQITKRLLTVLMIPMMLLTMINIPTASAKDSLGLNVDAAILVDAETGKILYAENIDKSLGIASMTKMMTEYLLFEAIDEGKVTWDQEYRVTDYTYTMSQDRRLSNVPLREDGTYTVKELYEATAIYSANAATVALAEVVAGTEKEFVNLMNEKAEELGLKDYKFVNASGLNNEFLQGNHLKGTKKTDENMMPTRSVAILAYHLLKEYPEVLETSKVQSKLFRKGTSDEIKMDNWNFMLPGAVYEYKGIDGLKTGTTDFAGHTFTATAKRGDKRLISVVMNALDDKGKESPAARFNETRKLLDYGFAQFSEEELVPAGYEFKDHKTLPVQKGKEKAVKIAVKDPVSMMIKTKDRDLYTPELVIDKSLLKDGELEAPLEKGTVVGHVQMTHEEDGDAGYIEHQYAGEVILTEDVEKAGWFKLSMRATGSFFSNIWASATKFVKELF